VSDVVCFADGVVQIARPSQDEDGFDLAVLDSLASSIRSIASTPPMISPTARTCA
jgi:hypothetical protein